MVTRRIALALVLLVFLLPAIGAEERPVIMGYSPQAAATEWQWEQKFRAIPDPANLREYNRRLSARPHHVGSPYDKANAEWILSQFKSWGWDAHIEEFDVLFPTPKERVVELVAPSHFKATLQEPAVNGDPTSSQTSEQLPTYNAYSADGDVTAALVYVNYGIPSDYEKLDRLGISVKGAIVIARYGASWRGIKPKLAAEHGAIGCIIYSDPADDGYRDGDVFPKGAWRPTEGVQRGSVMVMEVYPGDPLTPGVGATKDARRLALKDAKTIEKIPVLPISYGDAQPLLAALNGPVAPPAFRGGLPITYHLGPGAAKVHLKVLSNWDIKPVYDVIARIPGAVYPDEWVIRGNHHDAWVNGSEDPVSGQSSLLEEARAMGELVKQGWRPKRTIIYCAWDGEEEGLLGSTEWAEEHADDLKKHAVMYVNSDANGRGYLMAEGSHSLEKFVNGVAEDVVDPETKLSVAERVRLARIRRTHSAGERRELRTTRQFRIGALGSGSDYSAFIDHLGVATLNMGYGGEDGGGIYHSIYDDFYWYTHFSDTNFIYGRALSQTIGTAVLRMADAELLPFDFTNLADTVGRYVDEVKKLADTERAETAEMNREIREGVFTATADPHQHTVPPAVKPLPPYLNFAPLENSLTELRRSAEGYSKLLEKLRSGGQEALEHASLETVNETLMQSGQKLTQEDGLPGRPWYKNQIYAPGMYTGYGVKTLPGVREAIEQRQWKQADDEIAIAAQTLENEANIIDSATTQLEKAIQ